MSTAAIARATLREPYRPKAVAATYRAADDMVAITLATGVELAIPRQLLQGLDGATPAQLAGVEILGVEDRRIIIDALRLPFLKNDLVVQIELDSLSPTVKRELFSTTRDRLKRGARYSSSMRSSKPWATIRSCNNTRRRLRLLEKQQKTDYKKLRRRFAELIEKFRPGEEAAAHRSETGTNGSVAAGGSSADGGTGEEVPPEPLPTLAHPTFLRIKRSDGPLRLRRARRSALVVESDAPNGYLAVHENARLVLVDPTLTSVKFIRTSDFRGGRARLSVRTDLPVESTGTIGARLTDATGSVFSDEAPYLVVEPTAARSCRR